MSGKIKRTVNIWIRISSTKCRLNSITYTNLLNPEHRLSPGIENQTKKDMTEEKTIPLFKEFNHCLYCGTPFKPDSKKFDSAGFREAICGECSKRFNEALKEKTK